MDMSAAGIFLLQTFYMQIEEPVNEKTVGI